MRRTPFKNRGAGLTRKPMKQGHSRKVTTFAAELDAISPALFARAAMHCELKIPGVCLGRHQTMSRHHRKPRGQGGENTMENLLLLCGSGVTGCHGYVESHRTEAYEKGWLVKSCDDPAWVEVKR